MKSDHRSFGSSHVNLQRSSKKQNYEAVEDKENNPQQNARNRSGSATRKGSTDILKNSKSTHNQNKVTPLRSQGLISVSTPDLTKTVPRTKGTPAKGLPLISEHEQSSDSNNTKESGEVKPLKHEQATIRIPYSVEDVVSKNKQIYQNMLEQLTSKFNKSLMVLSQDPLMSVFREKAATQEFMFSRLQEILSESIKDSTTEYTKSLIEKVQSLNLQVSELTALKNHIEKENIEIKNLHQQERLRHDRFLEEKVKEFSQEIESYKSMVAMVESGKVELESQIHSLKNYIKDMVEDHKKSESHAIEALKDKEKIIESLRQEISDKASIIKKTDEVIDDIKRQSENLMAELSRKEAEKQGLNQSLEEAQSNFDKNQELGRQLIDDLNRELAQKDEQLKAEKIRSSELEELINNDNKLREIIVKMKSLEEELELKKDELDVYCLNLEESEFNNGQLDQSIVNLKQEMTEMSQKLIEQRQKNHQTELQAIQLQDKHSELSLCNSNLAEEVNKLKQENFFLKKSSQETEQFLKQSRREAATLERELDQFKFSTSTLTRENNELIVSFKNQIDHLKSENTRLSERLEKGLKDYESKLELERSSHLSSKDKIRVLEALEERMKIEIDNLSKKVSFFKASTLKATHASESQIAAHCSLIETTQLKSSVAQLLRQTKSMKDQYRKERELILDQVNFFYNTSRSVFEIMAIRIREEAKKNTYLSNDVRRLVRDLEHLKKVNDDFSIRLKESRSLSKMTSMRQTYDSIGNQSAQTTHRSSNTNILMNANYIPEESTQRSEFQKEPEGYSHVKKYNSKPLLQEQRAKQSVSPQNYERSQRNQFMVNRLSHSEFLEEEEEDAGSNLNEHHSHINHQSFGQYDFSTQLGSCADRETSHEKYQKKLQELQKPMPKQLFKKKNTDSNSQLSLMGFNNFDELSVNEMQTKSQNAQMQHYLENTNYQKQFRSQVPANKSIERQTRPSFNQSHNTSDNSFINNLNLKLLSVTSATKVNPQRAKIQTQSSQSTLANCSFLKKQDEDFSRLADHLLRFDPTIKEETEDFSQSNVGINEVSSHYQQYQSKHTYGYDDRNKQTRVSSLERAKLDSFKNQQNQRKPNFNATYQPDRFNYDQASNYGTSSTTQGYRTNLARNLNHQE